MKPSTKRSPDEIRVVSTKTRPGLHPGYAFLLCLAACSVGPDYVKPPIAVPATYKERPASPPSDWTLAQPADDAPRGTWWTVFHEPELDALEVQVDAANQSLAQAEAQYRQAVALVGESRAGFFPTVGVSASATRTGHFTRTSVGTAPDGTPIASKPSSSFDLPLSASWEPDLWGRVRRAVESSRANAQASAALLESTRLSLHAQLAQDWFQLRTVDAQRQLLDDTVANLQRSLKLTQNQYDVGVAARADVVQAQAQLETAKAQAIDLGVQRAQLEHAIALLVGKAPAEVAIPVRALATQPPAIPAGVPSQLLERRPDIAQAERAAQAANAQIGVATAAYFPNLTLNAGASFQSSTLSHWFDASSAVWSLGASLAQTLFDGGLRRAQVASARAGFDAAAANYREVALAALQNVEDELAAVRILDEEARVQDAAVKASQDALRIAMNQYRAGLVSYLNVVVAQNTAYASERTRITLQGTRMIDTVALIKALGGGWSTADLR